MGEAEGEHFQLIMYSAVIKYPQKDYIPHLGDCIDLVILGAGWDIDRARELLGSLFLLIQNLC